jgi:hypothetical protein
VIADSSHPSFPPPRDDEFLLAAEKT